MESAHDKLKKLSKESTIQTIEIVKKLEKEGKFAVYPYPRGVSYSFKECVPTIREPSAQDRTEISSNLNGIHHVAFHILAGTEEEAIKQCTNSEIFEAIRNKYIDETFRNKFYVGSTSTAYLLTDVEYNVSKKLTISDTIIEPAVPYLTLELNLIEALTGENKKIPIDMDISTFNRLLKQLDEINMKFKNITSGCNVNDKK